MSHTLLMVLISLMFIVPICAGAWHLWSRYVLHTRKNRARNLILKLLQIQEIEECWIIRVVQEDGIDLSMTEIQQLLNELTKTGSVLSRVVQGGTPGPWRMYSLPKETIFPSSKTATNT